MSTRRFLILLSILLLTTATICAQTEDDIKSRLSTYFDNYSNKAYTSADKMKIEAVTLLPDSCRLTISMNEAFQGQPFTPQLVDSIYRDVRNLLPMPYNTWQLTITSCGSTLEQLVPITLQQHIDTTRTWGSLDYKGLAWTRNMDRAYRPSAGLEGRHIGIWASHGRYYAQDKKSWLWQRPNLFNTCEDMFTQTFVIPFIMPMLENAGAVVYSPRERDWQTNEVIVDNDDSMTAGEYIESTGEHKWGSVPLGFTNNRQFYVDRDNPFEEGTARQCTAQTSKRNTSSVTWMPDIPEDGHYAVYVSYKTLPNSVPDAMYKVRHGGVTTRIRVNQQMGGGTWVYLGSFDFQKGESINNSIQLTNHSNYRGVVTADAVRLGGGMGNIQRGDTLGITGTQDIWNSPRLTVSGLPRYLEGARYYTQWAGMPYRIYGTKNSQNDYGEDINARSLGLNHLARGSVFMPNDTLPGLKVPLELSLAVHSDAGLRKNMDIVGSLGIYTTQFYDGRLATGLSRLASRDLAEMMLSQVTGDMQRSFGCWTRRQLYDRNYSESREPQIPSMILEMFSHQNYADMLMGHDPLCKFIFSRAVYKAVLRYISYMHGVKSPVVQPLPVHGLSAQMDAKIQTITLRWHQTRDSLEATAAPTSYILYTAKGNDGGWSNGMLVEDSMVTVPAEPGTLYRFKVTALNTGGQSMPSAEVCARCPIDTLSSSIMIINGFNRMAAPQAVCNDSIRAFDVTVDPGLGYISNPSIYSLGGENIAGNSFNYPTLHAKDFLQTDSLGHATLDIAVSSCTADALADVDLTDYNMADVILGAQRNDCYSHRDYTAFTPALMQSLKAYHENGGRLLVSGAYIGEDLQNDDQKDFAHDVLKFKFSGQVATDSLIVSNQELSFSLISKPNRQIYSTARVNALTPVGTAFTTLLYNGEQAAAVAYKKGNQSIFTFGFPLELIASEQARRKIMTTAYYFLCKD